MTSDHNPPGAAETGGAVELLACPGCGKIDALTYETDQIGKWGFVICGCDWRGPDVRTSYEKTGWEPLAATAWNTRAPVVSSQAGELTVSLINDGRCTFPDCECIKAPPCPHYVHASPCPYCGAVEGHKADCAKPTPAPGEMELADELKRERGKSLGLNGTIRMPIELLTRIETALRTAAQSAVRKRTIEE